MPDNTDAGLAARSKRGERRSLCHCCASNPKEKMPGEEGRIKRLQRRLFIRNVLVREAMAEFVGTYILVLFGCGSVAQVQLSGGLKGQFLTINLAFGFAVTMGLHAAAGVSGGHLNPAVSLAFAVLGRFAWNKVPVYMLAQLLGAFMGAGTVFGLYYDAFLFAANGNYTIQLAGVFATYPSEHLSLGNGFVDQLIGTAALLVCIMAVIDKRNNPAPQGMQPFIVGLVVVLIGLSMGFNAGYAVNPARDLGPRLFTAMAGWGWEVFSSGGYWSWVPVVAPMIGGVLGAFVYELFVGFHLVEALPRPALQPPPSPRDQKALIKLQPENMADVTC